ncbi:MAG: PQQ-binding-like beta-propeller repeat protein [Acidobacteria bacterium]|nr:PQQ-binding-like beta-propeller repeat protein [Acidobacteriota bacterium]
MRLRVWWLALAAGGTLPGAYSSLVATADGSAVFFEVRSGFRATRWYQARMEAGSTVLREVERRADDISEDGATLASAFYGERYCGFGGSTCWTAAACSASLWIDGPAGRVDTYGRKTFVRLSRDGRRAWIEQSALCLPMGMRPPAEYQGLYELSGMRPVAPSGGLTLVSRRSGRRLITTGGQILARAANTQLHLVDAGGARPIRHQYGAGEAVLDAAGRNVVYVDGAPAGRVRWIDLARQSEEDPGGAPLTGSAPALSDDGRRLVLLSPEGWLLSYSRETGRLERLAADGRKTAEFVLAGNGRFVFAVTDENRLLRIDADSGKAETWLEPYPEIRDASSGFERDPEACPLICYVPVEPLVPLGRGSLLVLGGTFWPPGWRVRVADAERPLEPLSAGAAWFQAPSKAPEGRQSLVVFHPQHPLRFTATAQVSSRFVSCFGALHQGFDRIVSSEDPARTGEIVHIFLTGLAGVEPMADGVPNPLDRLIPVVRPPLLGGEGALEPLFFGLAPGLIGVQQLDVRILGPVPEGTRLIPDAPSAANSTVPAVEKVTGTIFGPRN